MKRSSLRFPFALLLLAAAARAADPPEQPAPSESTRRVTYVPESVKNEIREEIKKEVLEQAKREGWAAPDVVPSWVQRFKMSGDARVRFERDIFARGNANTGDFPDFNAINTNKPFDRNFVDPANERYLNVDQNRTRFRLKARLGTVADIGSGFSAELRLASGDTNTPVSTSQTLGATGGVFSKYQVWIDRVAIRYQALNGALAVQLGRFENPFFGTVLLWSQEINFDGLAVQGAVQATESLRPFWVAGAFPIFTSAFAFPAEQPDKFRSQNKWLYAAQLGTEWKASSSFALKIAASFYDFDKVEGRFSDPCFTNLSFVSCSSDETRPSFAQKGNTYFPIRVPNDTAIALGNAGAPEYQFFGLASRFRELVATARLELKVSEALAFTLDGEYVHNAGFNRGQVANLPVVNNRGPSNDASSLGPYAGGNNGTFGRLSLGSGSLRRRWDWQAGVSYRYLQSDAVLDALNDPDFGLGGTNLKGYSLDATLAVFEGVYAIARWMSANQIIGPKYGVDVLQIDLYARF